MKSFKTTHIPLVDLSAQFETIRDDVTTRMQQVIQKTNFIMGEEIKEFEQAFCSFTGSTYTIGVSSGTDAIHLALKALDIQAGDEVIVPTHTFTATAEPVVWLGATPVFVDIDPKTYTIDPASIEKHITAKTKAIIPVHLYGHPADMERIVPLARKYNVKIIEDCAQAHGAVYMKKPVGSFGEIACYSFYPGKNLGAYGDAGAVTTNDETLAKKITLLRNHGRTEKYLHQTVGYGNRLDTLQAAVLLAKIPHLSSWNEKRRKLAAAYSHALADCKEIILPADSAKVICVYHLYVIRSTKRDALRGFLKEKGIETGVHYPIPLHKQPAYRDVESAQTSLPEAEKAAKEILSLPLYPEMTVEMVEYTAQCIEEFYS